MYKKIFRFWFTIRHLKLQQIVYRLYYRVIHYKNPRIMPVYCKTWPNAATWPHWMPSKLVDNNMTFEFLNERGSVIDSFVWNNPNKSKLWLYHLHYFDDLNAINAKKKLDLHVRLLDRWINENPPLYGNGWEPYPLSLRIVNLVKWWSSHRSLIKDTWLISFSQQLQVLSKRLEYHILGNHLFANAKALVFAGAFLDGRFANRCLNKGLCIIDQQLKEQFLEDGGHFELSPMYHAILLWDICDLLNLTSVSSIASMQARIVLWQSILRRGLQWLWSMSHPDGEIGFFNDAAFGIAPNLRELQSYATHLGFIQTTIKNPKLDFPIATLLEKSGYCRVTMDEDCIALLDLAKVGPDYLPGHAHADTLSFEMSFFGQRVFVNSGTSTYQASAERLQQRGTSAHNTVVINHQNSSEVWSAFRVARRASPIIHHFETQNKKVVIEASHNGYQRLSTKNRHHRKWIFKRHVVEIEDWIDGAFDTAQSYLHIHPSVRVISVDTTINQVCLQLVGKKVIIISIENASLEIANDHWHPYFGAALPNQCLIATFKGPKLKTNITWKKIE